MENQERSDILNSNNRCGYWRLDVAVFATYCRLSNLDDEEILERLLSLNLERKSRYG